MNAHTGFQAVLMPSPPLSRDQEGFPAICFKSSSHKRPRQGTNISEEGAAAKPDRQF